MNKIDEIVKQSLETRTIKPSASAWERLSNQLEIIEESPKRINWFKYAGYAASILLLISVAFFINTNDDIEPITPTEVVTSPKIDVNDFVKPTITNTTSNETVIVKNEKPSRNQKKNTTKKNLNVATKLKEPSVVKQNSSTLIAENKTSSKLKTISTTSKIVLKPNRIKIDSEALLYAVINTAENNKDYHKKYDINKGKKTKQLKRKKIKINPNTILAEVEKSIDEETFKNNFMQVVKGKISGLASAFTNRNN